MATRLDQSAKDTLQVYGVSQAEWLRHHPNCDRCGCPDDRCIGHHHDEGDDCDMQYALRAELADGTIKVRPHLCMHYCIRPANEYRREPHCGNCLVAL